MSILLIFILFLIFYGCKVENNDDYLSLYQTTCVNGVFIMLVFFRHLAQYVTFSSLLDMPMVLIDKFSGQLIVTMFLFNSGFGIMQSIKNKKNYVDKIPKNRIFKIWFRFMICVCLYYIVNIILSNSISLSKFLLSLLCIESIGNSNWYILSMLVMWFLTFISFKFFKNNFKINYVSLLILSFIYIMILIIMDVPNYYYNTIVCYLYGIFYSENKNKIDRIFNKLKNWICALFINFILLLINALIILKNPNNVIIYELMSFFFVNCIVILLQKFKFNNKITFSIGKNLFGLYILQRIPMLILKQVGVASYNVYIYSILCFIGMLMLGYLFNYIVEHKKI